MIWKMSGHSVLMPVYYVCDSTVNVLLLLAMQVTSWNHNCTEVSQLLHKLSKNIDAMGSCGNASKSNEMTSIKTTFSDLFEKLLGNLLVEMEDIFLQIKVFM